MNLTVSIESAELRFKQILEEFFITVYDEKSLPSHGIEHHRRVWSYSKELLKLFTGRMPAPTIKLPSQLIIASYLHDIGMSVDTGNRHGIHSRDLCIQFLNEHNFRLNDYTDVLEAIEYHDRKDYTGNTVVSELLNILSVADDLDAFGFIGIFRYSEIYLKRGINPFEIGQLIKENAVKRFDNFEMTFGFAQELVLKHRKRFEILDNFFSHYNKQVGSYQFGELNPSGYCGVLELLINVVNKKIVLEVICREPDKYSDDPVICWFFNELKSEID